MVSQMVLPIRRTIYFRHLKEPGGRTKSQIVPLSYPAQLS